MCFLKLTLNFTVSSSRSGLSDLEKRLEKPLEQRLILWIASGSVCENLVRLDAHFAILSNTFKCLKRNSASSQSEVAFGWIADRSSGAVLGVGVVVEAIAALKVHLNRPHIGLQRIAWCSRIRSHSVCSPALGREDERALCRRPPGCPETTTKWLEWLEWLLSKGGSKLRLVEWSLLMWFSPKFAS